MDPTNIHLLSGSQAMDVIGVVSSAGVVHIGSIICSWPITTATSDLEVSDGNVFSVTCEEASDCVSGIL